MIEVTVTKRRFTVEGHALVGRHQAPAVCAMVSILTRAVAEDIVRFRVTHGRDEFSRRNVNAKVLLACLEVLAERFPRNLRIVRR